MIGEKGKEGKQGSRQRSRQESRHKVREQKDKQAEREREEQAEKSQLKGRQWNRHVGEQAEPGLPSAESSVESKKLKL